jgi:hypothetical protein
VKQPLIRAAKIAALAGLAVFVLLRGIVPAVSGISSDFPGYYTAAKIVADGRDTQRLYDDAWFREQIRRYGLEDPRNPGKFAPFPPPTALLLVPLTPLQPLAALRVVVVLDLVCLILAAFLVSRIVAWPLLESALFVLAAGLGIVSCLRFGQPYILVSTFCLLGYYLYATGRPWLAGLSLGVFAPIKYFPVVPLACLACARQWKVALGGAIAILAVVLASVSVVGWKVHEVFLASVFGKHLIGRLSLGDSSVPFTAVYQSFDTLVSRLFVPDATWNPQPFVSAPGLRAPTLVAVKALLLLVAAAALVRLARTEGRRAAGPAIGVVGILVLLIAPATATYTFVLLWLPVALLVAYFLSRGERTAAYVTLVTYVLIGFIPYGHTYPFEGRGGLTVLAFPRLFVMLAMFVAAACFVALPRRRQPPLELDVSR